MERVSSATAAEVEDSLDAISYMSDVLLMCSI